MSQKLLEQPGLELIMVDTWKPFPVGHSYYNGSIKIARMSDIELESAYKEAKQRVSSFDNRCRIFRLESADAAQQIFDESVDLVFLDGDHSFEGVTRDLEAWYKKVKEGGYIGGHDYGHPEQGQVEEAVKEWFGIEKIKDIELDVNRTWFIKVV
jgi:hypothetical protein